MTGFPYPYVIMASDGRVIRTLQAERLGVHRAAVEAALADILIEKAPPAVACPTVSKPAVRTDTLTQREIAAAQGFTGDCCDTCGAFAMKRGGTCLTCTACGSTTGCG